MKNGLEKLDLPYRFRLRMQLCDLIRSRTSRRSLWSTFSQFVGGLQGAWTFCAFRVAVFATAILLGAAVCWMLYRPCGGGCSILRPSLGHFAPLGAAASATK